MIVNSKIKYKSNTMLNFTILDFILYFVTVYMNKCSVPATSAQGTTQNTLYITRGSK